MRDFLLASPPPPFPTETSLAERQRKVSPKSRPPLRSQPTAPSASTSRRTLGGNWFGPANRRRRRRPLPGKKKFLRYSPQQTRERSKPNDSKPGKAGMVRRRQQQQCRGNGEEEANSRPGGAAVSMDPAMLEARSYSQPPPLRLPSAPTDYSLPLLFPAPGPCVTVREGAAPAAPPSKGTGHTTPPAREGGRKGRLFPMRAELRRAKLLSS